MDVIDFLSNDGYIIVNKKIAKEIGLNEAILLGELCSEYKYWRNQNKLENGWFFSTIENVEENTTLSAYQQRKSLKILEDLKLIEVRLKGTPPVRHIFLNVENLNNQMFKNFTFKSEKSESLNVKKVDVNNNKNINNNNNNLPFSENKSDVSSFNEDKADNIIKGSSKNIRDIITTIYRNDSIDEEIKQLLVQYYKTVKRGFTVDQVIMQIKTLQELTNNVKSDMIFSIKNSIERSYSGFYFNQSNRTKPTNDSAETIFNKMTLDDAKNFQNKQVKNAKDKGWIF